MWKPSKIDTYMLSLRFFNPKVIRVLNPCSEHKSCLGESFTSKDSALYPALS
jgi:hypothetical protein